MDRAPERRRVAAFVLAGLPWLASCRTPATLSNDEVWVEYDSVANWQPDAAPPLSYRDEVLTHPWYMRTTLFPVRQFQLLNRLFLSTEPGLGPIENPPERARECLAVLCDDAIGNETRTAKVALRLLRVAEFDGNPLHRLQALQHMGELALALEWNLATGLEDADSRLQQIDEAGVLAFRSHHPNSRKAPLDDPARAAYVAVLERLAAAPLRAPAQRVAAVADLIEAERAETDPTLREITGRTLHVVLRASMHRALAEAVLGEEPALAPVRLQAISVLIEHGGHRLVPVLLAWMALPRERATLLASPIDTHHLLQLRMIHLCGQLHGEELLRAARLPGLDPTLAVSAATFLCRRILAEDTFVTSLRIPAQEALCRALGRDLDYDLGWVRTWFAAHRDRT